MTFVPAEVLVFYGGIVGCLNSVTPATPWRLPLAWACLAAGALFTPAYVLKRSPVWDAAAFVIATVSALAFMVWAYSLGGVFAYSGWYHPAIAAILALFFTLLSGFVPLPSRKAD